MRTSCAAGKKKSAVTTNGKVPKKVALKRSPPKRATKASTPKLVPKGTEKGGKGKVISVDVNGSDEDSLGFDDKGIMEAMQTMQKEIKSKEPLIITVSPGFVNVSSEERVYIIIFPKPNKTFYVKPYHTKALVIMAVTKHKILNPSEDSD